MTVYWIIQNKVNKRVLPTPPSGRGGTHVEPVALTSHIPPRLFGKHSGAVLALQWWLEGKTSCMYNAHGKDNLVTQPKPDRKAEDWEIVPVTLGRSLLR